ncbi:MAG: restriction endonuclease subunit S [Yaniella sp.]|nr:restriction endonuclease subunit S [Yaniella sp.]
MNRPVRELSLKYYADVNPSTDEFKTMPEGEQVAFLPLENIWAFGTADYSRSRLWKKSETSYTQFRRGDVLVPKVTPTVFHGRSMVAEPKTEVGLATSEVHVLRPKDGVDRRWIAYNVLSSQFLDRARGNVYGVGGLQRISAGYLGDYKVLETDIASQRRIADYLDRETAEIDAAVADLDRYVELLEKRKRATGLAILEQARHEPTTLMVHLGSLGLFVSGSGFPHRYQGVEGEEFPFYKVGSLSTADEDGIIQDSRHSVSREVAEELGAKIIPTGSVLMAKIGEAMRLCRFVVTATDCCIDNNMMAIIPRQDNITSDYLRLALELVTVDVLVNPGPVPSLNVQGLRMFSIPLPSVGVQKRMTTEWNKETDRLDSLIAESTRLRDLLLKRRSVLITEVVTGRKRV